MMQGMARKCGFYGFILEDLVSSDESGFCY